MLKKFLRHHRYFVVSRMFTFKKKSTKEKQTHRYRKQVNCYQSGEGSGAKKGLRDETQITMHNIHKQHGYLVQHKKLQPLFCNNF